MRRWWDTGSEDAAERPRAWRSGARTARRRSGPPSRRATIATGLLLGTLLLLVGLVAGGLVAMELARAWVHPDVALAELPRVQGTVERASLEQRTRQTPDCSWRIYLAEIPEPLNYACNLPEFNAVRAAATPGAAVEAWLEPPAWWVGDHRQGIWQLQVNGRLVVSREQVAAARQAQAGGIVLATLPFALLSLLFSALGVAGLVSAARAIRQPPTVAQTVG